MAAFSFFPKTGANDLEGVLTPKKKENFLTQFLPEDEDKKRALARSLIMGGASAMAAGGPSAKPMNFLSVLGQGLAGGVGAYDQSLENDLEANKLAAANKINNVKLQTLQDSQNRAKTFVDKYGAPSANGYSVEALFALHQMQLANGDEESARATQKMIQELQQTAAGNGMVLGDNGYELAPGYGESLRETKAQESLGNAVGQNAQITADQKDFRFGQDNPAFREYELKKTRAGVAQPDKFGGKADELAAERFAGYQAEGLKARETVANMGRLADLSRSIGTGTIANLKKTYGPYAQAMGIEVDGLSDIQLFDSMVAKIAPSMRVPGSGASSDLDVNMFLRSLPTLSNTTEGNALIAETTSAIEANKIKAGEIANRVMADEISWQDGEKEIQALPDPLEKFKKFKGNKSAASEKGPRITVVSSEEEFNALPAGSAFRFSDEETVRTKR